MNFAKAREVAFVVAILAAPAAMAQTTPPTADGPSATQPTPPITTQPQGLPRATAPAPAPVTSALLGKEVFSADQSRLGKVEKVISGADGKVQSILIKTGGFLGFGGRMVAIPDSKFVLKGSNIQVQMTAEEVSKLPEEKDQS